MRKEPSFTQQDLNLSEAELSSDFFGLLYSDRKREASAQALVELSPGVPPAGAVDSCPPVFTWTKCAIDSTGRFLQAKDSAAIKSISLSRPYLKQDGGPYFWFKTWRCPDVTVTLGENLPHGLSVRLRAVIQSADSSAVRDAQLNGETVAPVVAGVARLSGIYFESTSFNNNGALFSLLVELQAPPRLDGARECWLTPGIRVLSKRKQSSGVPTARDSRKAPRVHEAASPAGLAGSALGRPLSIGVHGTSQAPPALAQVVPGSAPSVRDVPSSIEEQFVVPPVELKHLRTSSIPRLACASRPQLAALGSQHPLSPGVSNLVCLSPSLPAWLSTLACTESTSTVALTFLDVGAAMLPVLAESTLASLPPISWCSQNMDRHLANLSAFLGGKRLDAFCATLEPDSSRSLADTLRSFGKCVEQLKRLPEELDLQLDLDPTTAGSPNYRLVADCGPIAFAHGDSLPPQLRGKRMEAIAYYNVVTRRLSLFLNFVDFPESAGSSLRSLCDSLLDYLKLAESTGYGIYGSRASCAIFGFEPWETVGGPTGEWIHAEDSLKLRDAVTKTPRGQPLLLPRPMLSDRRHGYTVTERIETAPQGAPAPAPAPAPRDVSDRTEAIVTSQVRGIVRCLSAHGWVWIDYVATFKWKGDKALRVLSQVRPSMIHSWLLWDQNGAPSPD